MAVNRAAVEWLPNEYIGNITTAVIVNLLMIN